MLWLASPSHFLGLRCARFPGRRRELDRKLHRDQLEDLRDLLQLGTSEPAGGCDADRAGSDLVLTRRLGFRSLIHSRDFSSGRGDGATAPNPPGRTVARSVAPDPPRLS